MKSFNLTLTLAALAISQPTYASQAYGSLNNFDVVNDNGTECHGFEIEIEDIHSRDITYTYDWNHYGTPRIEEDNSDPLYPIVRVFYEAKKNPDGSWNAYTAVPAGAVAPTDGHQFIDPTVNFGGEHFGVGFYGIPGTVRYFWLLDDGFGSLVRGTSVDIATPAFVYYPPAGGNPGQVGAVIQPPEPEQHFREFGEATWVKVTTTTSHNDRRVELRDLVSDDPDDDDDRNWRNGEPDEVEIEWQLLQTEFNQDDGGKNGMIENEPQELPEGDEVITIRYDFFKYVGPHDPESYEALCDNVGPDGIHGEGIDEDDEGNIIDFSTIEVVGDYIGAQMAGFDVAGQMGLIDHVQEAELSNPYIQRRIVIDGTPPIVTTIEGALPEGMEFDVVEGLLSGTPLQAGEFTFTVHSVDAAGADLTREYQLRVIDPLAPEGEGSQEGLVEGFPEGSTEGMGEGTVEGSLEGIVEGALEGAVEGSSEGSIEGSPEGSLEGALEGEGAAEGDSEGMPEGEIWSTTEELLRSFATLDSDGSHALDIAESRLTIPAMTPEQFTGLDTNNDGQLTVAELLAAVGSNILVHSADTDGDKVISIGELIRVIQLYNAGSYACLNRAGDSEDGYAPGIGNILECTLPHAADYEHGADGRISLGELLRMIQFFSLGTYSYCPNSAAEDGFCMN